METQIPNRLSALGHPQRLALFRLLMRRYPDRVPATELALALGLKPNTLSTYVSALMQVGLITQERIGTSLRYAIAMNTARETVDYLLHDCCRGRPEICAPTAAPDAATSDTCNVLFICTGNSARSIMAEAILRDMAGERFVAHSAGTKAQSKLNPDAIDLLDKKGHDISALQSKSIKAFQTADTPDFDFVFTVCNQAANEDCPPWAGQTISAHWGLPDPVTTADKNRAFHQTYDVLRDRISAFIALPMESLDRLSLQRAVDDIAQSTPERSI